jgi:hypothetical protein
MDTKLLHTLIEQQPSEDAAQMTAECGFQSAAELVAFYEQNETQITEAIVEGASLADAMIIAFTTQHHLPYQAEDLESLRTDDREAMQVSYRLLSMLHADRAVGDIYTFEAFRDGDGRIVGHDISLNSDDSKVFQSRYTIGSQEDGEPSKIQQIKVKTPIENSHMEAIQALKEKFQWMQSSQPKQSPSQKSEGER